MSNSGQEGSGKSAETYSQSFQVAIKSKGNGEWAGQMRWNLVWDSGVYPSYKRLHCNSLPVPCTKVLFTTLPFVREHASISGSK